MNQFEESRVERIIELQRERALLLGHKFQAKITEYVLLSENLNKLTDAIIQSQNNIKTLAKSLVTHEHIDANLNLKQCFTALRSMPFNSNLEIDLHIEISRTLGFMVAEFLILERCLKGYKNGSHQLKELRRELAPDQVEEFILSTGQFITVIPVVESDESLIQEVTAFSQSQSIQELADGFKFSQTRPKI